MPMIDLNSVEIHNSPDVRGWAETATITRLEFRPTGVHVEHTKRLGPGCWPNFRPEGWEGDLQYTLWLVEQINGRWHGSGGIQYWQDCDQNGGPPEEFAKNWFYAADRWGVMTGHQPAPGDLCGFMVTAGDARNNGTISVRERSNLVVMPFPTSGAVYVEKASPLLPEVLLPVTPIPPHQEPPIDPAGSWEIAVARRLKAVEAAISALGDPATVVHVGAKVKVSGTVRFIGPVSGTGSVTTTGPE